MGVSVGGIACVERFTVDSIRLMNIGSKCWRRRNGYRNFYDPADGNLGTMCNSNAATAICCASAQDTPILPDECAALVLLLRAYQVGGAFANHHARCVGMASDDGGHDRGVRYPQLFDPADLQFGRHDAAGI